MSVKSWKVMLGNKKLYELLTHEAEGCFTVHSAMKCRSLAFQSNRPETIKIISRIIESEEIKVHPKDTEMKFATYYKVLYDSEAIEWNPFKNILLKHKPASETGRPVWNDKPITQQEMRTTKAILKNNKQVFIRVLQRRFLQLLSHSF